ncbi:MAG: hypothetical protein KGJ02_05855 [Verrucomicrobiota bacterium]|nr:hypothetical protein [Verrucomicrobiota bacterium]
MIPLWNCIHSEYTTSRLAAPARWTVGYARIGAFLVRYPGSSGVDKAAGVGLALLGLITSIVTVPLFLIGLLFKTMFSCCYDKEVPKPPEKVPQSPFPALNASIPSEPPRLPPLSRLSFRTIHRWVPQGVVLIPPGVGLGIDDSGLETLFLSH